MSLTTHIISSTMCSTPFGIEARRTPGWLRGWIPRRRCAQRLSASRQGGRAACPSIFAITGLCSTPFGIEARRTGCPAQPDALRVAGVLNAFRHRGKEDSDQPIPCGARRGAGRCSTPFGIEARRTGEGWPRSPGFAGAQRLSASRQGGRPGLEGHPRSRLTRAQRLSASRQGGRLQIRAISASPRPCSTPFGIEARRTRSRARELRPRRRERAQRLSASRQGGPCAAMCLPQARSLAMCSTPFGIEARRT